MQGPLGTSRIRSLTILTAMAVSLSGCLMDEEKSKSNEEVAQDNRLFGSVGDGPVVGAEMKIIRNDGEAIARFTSDDLASYDVTIRTRAKNYPLQIVTWDGIDLVTGVTPDFDMASVVLSQEDTSVANVNPFTTITVEAAKEMDGGVNAENIEMAEAFLVAELSSGLTTIRDNGPLRTAIDEKNIAEIVKSSETLAEIIRRVRDLHLNNGRSTSGNQVLRAIASDITDGKLDGMGAARTEPRVSALTTVVSAAVYLEAMQNHLRVNGERADDAMNDAIMETSPSTPMQFVEDIAVTQAMIDRVRLGLAACLAVEASGDVQDLLRAFDGVQPGMDASLIQTLLPNNYEQVLDAAIETLANAPDKDIDTVNAVAQAGVDEPSVNQAPAIQGSAPRTVVAGSLYSFRPSAVDPDGDTLTFEVGNRPAWATFNTATGLLSGTPSAADVGNYRDIRIRVTDGEYTTNLPVFSIEVMENNSPPTISGNPPAQVLVGDNYTFTPTASDPDGHPLTFSIENRPPWANFDNTDGRLSGTPGSADVGEHGSIRITVTDGRTDVSLPSFSILVNAIGLSSVTLDWTPPTANDDGSPLTNLTGYRVYWGTSAGNYNNSATINNAGLTTYVVGNLGPGDYEFVVTAVNSMGMESEFSAPASVTIN